MLRCKNMLQKELNISLDINRDKKKTTLNTEPFKNIFLCPTFRLLNKTLKFVISIQKREKMASLHC